MSGFPVEVQGSTLKAILPGEGWSLLEVSGGSFVCHPRIMHENAERCICLRFKTVGSGVKTQVLFSRRFSKPMSLGSAPPEADGSLFGEDERWFQASAGLSSIQPQNNHPRIFGPESGPTSDTLNLRARR